MYITSKRFFTKQHFFIIPLQTLIVIAGFCFEVEPVCMAEIKTVVELPIFFRFFDSDLVPTRDRPSRATAKFDPLISSGVRGRERERESEKTKKNIYFKILHKAGSSTTIVPFGEETSLIKSRKQYFKIANQLHICHEAIYMIITELEIFPFFHGPTRHEINTRFICMLSCVSKDVPDLKQQIHSFACADKQTHTHTSTYAHASTLALSTYPSLW